MVCNTKLVKNIKQQKTASRKKQKTVDSNKIIYKTLRHRVLNLLIELRQCHLVVWDNPQHWDKEQNG